MATIIPRKPPMRRDSFLLLGVAIAALFFVQARLAAAPVEVGRLMFAGENAASRLLLEQLGVTVTRVLHPLCRHGATAHLASKEDWHTFRTAYRFGQHEHVLFWRLKLEQGLVADVVFVEDSNPVQTGKLANQAKALLAAAIRAYLERQSR